MTLGSFIAQFSVFWLRAPMDNSARCRMVTCSTFSGLIHRGAAAETAGKLPGAVFSQGASAGAGTCKVLMNMFITAEYWLSMPLISSLPFRQLFLAEPESNSAPAKSSRRTATSSLPDFLCTELTLAGGRKLYADARRFRRHQRLRQGRVIDGDALSSETTLCMMAKYEL